MSRAPLALASLFVVAACGRSTATLDAETQAQLDTASENADTALANSSTNAADIDALDTRVDALEGGGDGDGDTDARLTAVEQSVVELEDADAALTLRVTTLELQGAPSAATVPVDDRVAAGFPAAAPVDTIEDGFSYLNERANLHAGRLDDLELAEDAASTTLTAHDAAIADLTARTAALEAFNDTDLAAVVDALIDARIAPLEAELAALREEAGQGTVLGLSAQTSTGRFEFNGYAGVRAATEMCKATFVDEPTAHLCSLDETQRALATGRVLDVAVSGVNTWTVSGATRAHGTEDAFTNATSLATSCYALLSDANDVATGTRARIDLGLPGAGVGGVGVNGDALVVEPNRPCDAVYAVMCCR